MRTSFRSFVCVTMEPLCRGSAYADRCSATQLNLVIGAWIKYFRSSTDELGNSIEVVDARSDELKRAVKSIDNDPRSFVATKSLFGSAYFPEPLFANDVEAALTSLNTFGTRETIRRYTVFAN